MTSTRKNKGETPSRHQGQIHNVVVSRLACTREGSVPVRQPPVLDTCLLHLVQAVGNEVEDDGLVAAIVANLVNTHVVRLQGAFKGARLLIV